MSDSVRIDEVECAECRGAGVIDELECPVCDGHGSIEGEVHTISLHNIRYDVRGNGSELWVIGGGREILLASVQKSADGRSWEIRSLGVTLGSFEEEAAALEVFKGSIRRLAEQIH